VLSKESRGRYDLTKCLAAYVAFKQQGGQSGTRDVTEARTRLYAAQTHKVELETERARCETIPADMHVTDMRELQKIINVALDNLEKALPGTLAGLKNSTDLADRIRVETCAVRERAADDIEAYAGTLES
jgi:hypothetical protein